MMFPQKGSAIDREFAITCEILLSTSLALGDLEW